MARARECQATYDAIDRFVKVGFTTHDSILTPGKAIWSPDVRDDLYQRFVLNPDESSQSFLEKLNGQLQNAPAETVQVAGELLYVQLLTPAGIGRKKKCELVEAVLAWSPQPVELSEELKQAFNRGLANDMSFMQQRPFQIAFLLEVFRKWDQVESARRKELLEDPWKFKTFLSDVPVRAAQPMREMLCHFVHPEHFEPISSRRHKRQILEAFRDRLESESGDPDRDILTIRKKLEQEHGGPISLYQRDISAIWRGDGSDSGDAWETFLQWAQRVRSSDSFDDREITYKYDIAANLKDAREAVLAGN